MKILVTVVGALLLVGSIGLVVYGLLLAADQINRAVAGIYAVALGVQALIMLQASNADDEVK